MARQPHYQPSSTKRVTISVADDLLPEFDALRDFLDAGEISLSRYLVTAAILCQRLGIDDPEHADFGDFLMGDILSADEWQPSDLDTSHRKNGHVTASNGAQDALDTMLDIF